MRDHLEDYTAELRRASRMRLLLKHLRDEMQAHKRAMMPVDISSLRVWTRDIDRVLAETEPPKEKGADSE